MSTETATDDMDALRTKLARPSRRVAITFTVDYDPTVIDADDISHRMQDITLTPGVLDVVEDSFIIATAVSVCEHCSEPQSEHCSDCGCCSPPNSGECCDR